MASRLEAANQHVTLHNHATLRVPDATLPAYTPALVYVMQGTCILCASAEEAWCRLGCPGRAAVA